MNYPQQSAQGLASLGRYGDSMLVHMSPKEVAGLQSLAMSKGGSLTINPDTGMPEAFILDMALPVAGAFFGIPPEFTAALMAGKTLIEGGDLGSAALSAFGGYTGGKMGQSLKSFVDPIQKLPTSAVNAVANTAQTLTGGGAGNIGAFNTFADKISPAASGVTNTATSLTNQFSPFTNNRLGTDLGIRNTTPTVDVNMGGYDAAAQTADSLKSSFAPSFAPSFGGQGMIQPGGADTLSTAGAPTYGANVGAGTDIGSTISQGASDFSTQFGAAVKNPVDFARHVGEGDALMGGAKIGMYAASPFIEGMMEPQTFTYTDPDKDKYRGPQGQLNLSDRFDTGLRLATGGTIQSGGIRDLYGTPDNQPTISPGLSGFGLGRLNNLAGEQAMTQAQTLGYADGGDVVAGETGMNLDALPTLNLNTGTSSVISSGNSFGNGSEMMGENSPLYRYLGVSRGYSPYTPQGMHRGLLGRFIDVPERVSTHTSAGMHRGLLGMARGGYLDGAGDGMSDSIPATIEGKQPARLADGEFVIPADVVSHIGNGSSKAGSKKLYAMLDKVRHARTGNKKQGKEIKADKYLPA
jgi:hypothetical protein